MAQFGQFSQLFGQILKNLTKLNKLETLFKFLKSANFNKNFQILKKICQNLPLQNYNLAYNFFQCTHTREVMTKNKCRVKIFSHSRIAHLDIAMHKK